MSVIEELVADLPVELAERYRRNWASLRPWGLGDNPALLVVDLTNYFAHTVDRTSTAVEPSVAHTSRLLEVFRVLALPIYFTDVENYATDKELGGWGRGLPAKDYPFVGTPEDLEIVGVLRPRSGEVLVTKPKPSAFFGTQLASMLVFERVDTVVVCGAGTSRCVRATVDDAFAYNFRTIVPIECVTGRGSLSWQMQLISMGVEIEVIADLVHVDDLIVDLQRRDSR